MLRLRHVVSSWCEGLSFRMETAHPRHDLWVCQINKNDDVKTYTSGGGVGGVSIQVFRLNR